MKIEICFILNSENVTVSCNQLTRLVDVLREKFDLTGVKEGCGEGECGACSVIMDDKLVSSCLIPAVTATGSTIMTIEGYRETKRYKVLEKAFEDAGAVQCGFCTPGMIMASECLFVKNPVPCRQEILDALSGNICRCTGYNMIVDAVMLAAERGKGLW